MKVLSLSVCDFALPVPRLGSIEAHSGYGRATLEGQEIHARIQAERVEYCRDYRAEVPISGEFTQGAYTFKVSGRLDGLFDSSPPRIEEIKSTFNIKDLKKKLTREIDTHPYCLQLLTYGYLYYQEHGKTPILQFHLVSSRTSQAENIEIPLRLGDYQSWLDRRLRELEIEAEESEKRAEKRRALGAELTFPFDKPRPSQVDLIDTVGASIKAERPLLVQAPTGLGKTVGVLFPSLKEALSRGHRVIYITPKNSQHAVAEDAIERFADSGHKLKSLTLTAKGKICFKNEPLCNPDYCEYARDHYTKVDRHNLQGILAKKRKLTSKVFRELGESYEVCPFELQLEAARQAEVVICDYNYVFAPRTAFGRLDASALGEEGKPNLVIDEAHNLPSRAMDYYSPALSTAVLEKMRDSIEDLPEHFQSKVDKLIDECIETVASCRPENATKSVKIDPPAGLFLDQEEKLRGFLSRYLDSDHEIPPRDVVLRLCSYWTDFTSALEFVAEPPRPEFFTTFQPIGPKGGAVKITCCDASQFLRDCYGRFGHVVAFSATLKPFEYYSKLSGLDSEQLQVAEFASPFSPEHRKLMIIPEISTKYSDRERNYRKIAEVITRISAVRAGNYFAFFPSFDFMYRVLDNFTAPPGFELLRQEREMKASAIEQVIEHLKRAERPTLVFGVQGGVFSEGVDYPDEMLVGAFVVGPPLPIFDLEREQMREYYQKIYGSGFEYAYAYPAMAKAVQAAGRVIRSETDRGLIVLMDSRFLTPSYSNSMPTDWFGEGPRELVSKQILNDVGEFWKK